MKKYIFILLYVFIFLTCKSQEEVIEYEDQYLIIFKYSDSLIQINEKKRLLLTYKDLNFTTDYKRHRIPISPMFLSFSKGKDTMNIMFFCGNHNIYIKNFEFKKGDYIIQASLNPEPKKLNKEETPKQKVICKNVLISGEGRKDIELKDMLFYEIDLKDTVNVEIEKVKKLDLEKFY